jgi:hypothetical protein
MKRIAITMAYGAAVLAVVLLVAVSTVRAETCRILEAKPAEGKFLIEIDGKQYIALSEEKLKKLKTDATSELDESKRKLEEKEKLLVVYEKLIEGYKKTMDDAAQYITGLEYVSTNYKKLAQDYKKLHEPWLTFEGGIGYTGDTDPAVMLGVGIKQFRVWGFLQEGNGGVLAGVSLPLF